MQQQDMKVRQLAQTVADFIEPALPYLVVSGSEGEEAGQRAGNWEIKRKLWERLCSQDCSELRKAAKATIVAPSYPEVKQALVQEILSLFELSPDLAKETSSFMEDKTVQKIMADEDSIKNNKQLSNDKNKIIAEFNNLLETFIAKSSMNQDNGTLEMQDTEKAISDMIIRSDNNNVVGKPQGPYTHIQLNQGITTEGSPINIRMAKIVQMDFKNQSEFQKLQTLLSLASQMDPLEKEKFMEEAFDFASKIQYEDLKAQILSLLILNLEGPGKAKFIEKAFFSASKIQNENERAKVFSSVAPHLRGQEKEELIERIFDFTSHSKYGDSKFQILSSLTPHLYGSKNKELIEKALNLASGIPSEYQRVQAFSLILPYLDVQRREEILEKALSLASGIKSESQKEEALSSLAPYLD
ncbi:MAG TPA: hypothetical protein VN278_05025 [Methanosarcina sp.]|nr:hypothetical protein [Methanosarcina sp.]